MRAISSGIVLSITFASAIHAGDYYPLKEGNQWTYTMSNGTQMSTAVTGFADVGAVRCAVVETAMGGQTTRQYVAADAQGLKAYMAQMQGQESRYDPPVVLIKLPYNEGDTWTAAVNYMGTAVNTTSQSIGHEQVQTPIGTFDCIKVRATAATAPPMVSIISYAQGIGPLRQVIQMA